MKAFTINYSPAKFERVVRAKCRVAFSINYDQRQKQVVKTIIEFCELRKLIKLKMAARVSSSYEYKEYNLKMLMLEKSIAWLKYRLSVKLVCDLKPHAEYIYIPKARNFDSLNRQAY